MIQNFRLHEGNVGGVGISSRDTDSRHHEGQKRQDFGAAIFTNGYFSGATSRPSCRLLVKEMSTLGGSGTPASGTEARGYPNDIGLSFGYSSSDAAARD